MESTPEQLRFQQALRADGFSLSLFRASPPANLFPDNYDPLPEFFQQNLVSPHRILKHFKNDLQGNIKIFYYQVLRVTYEVETEMGFNTSFMYNLIQIVFHEEFQLLFTMETESQRDLYNDFQFKKLFAEFIVMLQNQEQPNVEALLNSYPIMDSVFTHICRSVLDSQGHDFPYQAKVPTKIVFSEIGALLGLNIEEYNSNCWKFADSDMFCFEQSDYSLYLAYIHDNGPSSEDPSSGGNYSYESYNTGGTKIDGLGLYGSNAGSSGSADYLRQNITVTNVDGGYQSLDQMANRYVNVEPRHDIYESSSLAVPSGRNEVKESMISVTYDFVDFTGETNVYKDKVPKKQAQQYQQPSSLARSNANPKNDTGYTGGLDTYMNVQATSYESPSFSDSFSRGGYVAPPMDTYLPANNYDSSYKPTSFDSFSSITPKYEPRVEPPSFQPATGGYANAFSESLYSPAYKAPELAPVSPNLNRGYDPLAKDISKSFAGASSFRQEKFSAAPAAVSSSIFQSKYEDFVSGSRNFQLGDDLGDYYNDFTADNLLNAVTEPHRTKVLQIKSRVRGWKKSGIFSSGTVGR